MLLSSGSSCKVASGSGSRAVLSAESSGFSNLSLDGFGRLFRSFQAIIDNNPISTSPMPRPKPKPIVCALETDPETGFPGADVVTGKVVDEVCVIIGVSELLEVSKLVLPVCIKRGIEVDESGLSVPAGESADADCVVYEVVSELTSLPRRPPLPWSLLSLLPASAAPRICIPDMT